MIQQFSVSRDDSIYEAFPDVALAPSGRLVCVFSECTHHHSRDYTRIMLTDSTDRGRTWSTKRPLSAPLRGDPKQDPYWNCARISTMSDGRLVAVADRIAGRNEGKSGGEQSNWLWISADEGASWEGPRPTPVHGIVPDQLIELRHGEQAGRWLLAAHTILTVDGQDIWHVRVWHTDDRGATWHGPVTIAADAGLKLCEGSILELPGGELVCFMRENSGQGLDAFKAISRDGGESWGDLCRFTLPACHRPVAGMLPSGRVMITYRHMQGGKGWTGWWTQNLFAGMTDVESCLATERGNARTRIFPISFDRSPHSDTGYSGWVAMDDGELYVVNYLLDDAPKAQIRGYVFRESDLILPE